MSRTVSFDVLAVAKGVGFDELGAKVSGVVRDTNTQVSGLVTALVALGPALVPLTAGVAALGAGLTGLGAVGLLAFVGIRNEMKQGTVLGQAYTNAFKPIVDEFHALSYLAADRMFAGINSAVQSSRKLFPLLASDVSLLAGQLGQIVSHVAPGLVALFIRLNPLFLSLGAQLVKGSEAFQKWATSGTGVTKFVQYAQQQLPVVEHILINLVQALGRIVQGIAPLGGGSLSTIRLFSDVLAHLPVGVVQALAPALVGLLVASKVAGALNLLTGSLKRTTVAEAGTTAATGLLADTLATGLAPATLTAIGLYYILGPLLDKVAGNTGTFSDQLNTLRGKTLNAIPGVANFVGLTGRLAALADIASGKVRAVGGAMDGIPRNVNSNINVNAAAAKAQALGLLDILNAIPSEKYVQITTITNKIAAGSAGTNLAGRAGGGPVAAGQSYIVGEHRPEVFTPQQSGYITPYVPSGDIHVHLHGAVIGNTRQAIMEIKRGLEEISHNGQPLAVKIAGA